MLAVYVWEEIIEKADVNAIRPHPSLRQQALQRLGHLTASDKSQRDQRDFSKLCTGVFPIKGAQNGIVQRPKPNVPSLALAPMVCH